MLLITMLLLMGAITAYFANQRGRDPMIWFMVGMLFGLLGLLLLFILPVAPKEEEDKQVLDITPKIEPEPLPPANQYLSTDWFYLDQQQQQHGPVPLQTLKDLWAEAKISGESFVWSEGMPEWLMVQELPHLEERMKDEG
jgi:hypothetical protein